MLRVLVLIGAIMFFRSLLVRKRRRSLSTTSPYMNSLDGLMSAGELSSVMDELRFAEVTRNQGEAGRR